MKLVVFGATGKVGRHIVAQALAQGHAVTGFTRSPEKFDASQAGVRIVLGDVLDAGAVTTAVEGQDCAICALGMPLLNTDGLRADGTRIIIDAMAKTGVKRLVCLSGLGAGDSRDVLPWHYKYLLVPLLMRHLYADHERQEAHVRQSSLDWVIVRPGSFTKGPRTGAYRHGFSAADEPPALKISHADVADFLLRQVADNCYLGAAPAISY